MTIFRRRGHHQAAIVNDSVSAMPIITRSSQNRPHRVSVTIVEIASNIPEPPCALACTINVATAASKYDNPISNAYRRTRRVTSGPICQTGASAGRMISSQVSQRPESRASARNEIQRTAAESQNGTPLLFENAGGITVRTSEVDPIVNAK